MDDPVDDDPRKSPAPERPPGPLFIAGAVALLAAMTIDTLAVLGRHVGHALPGSIELVQAVMLVAASSALVGATLARKHAAVHLLVSRLPPRARSGLERVNALLCSLFFLALAAGSAWIAWDLRDGHEESEVLRIPYAPLRILGIMAVLATTAILVRQAFGRRRK